MPPNSNLSGNLTPRFRGNTRKSSISRFDGLRALACISNGPRERVLHDRFSMSLIPFTMSHAHGCLITITFMPTLRNPSLSRRQGGDGLHGYPPGGRFVKGARCVAVECCPSLFVDFRLARTTHKTRPRRVLG